MDNPEQQVRLYARSLGPLQTNCYAMILPDNRAWIIDPGMDPEPLIEQAQADHWDLQAIWLTHAHYDHIGGIHAVREALKPDAPIWIHEMEKNYLAEPEKNRSLYFGQPMASPEPTDLYKEGETLDAGGMTVRWMHTPGHSPGSVSLYVEELKLVFAGDALFQGGIGRTDFPDSDHNALITAIRDKLYALPDDTIVLSGHGGTTLIGREKKQNPYVQA